MINQYNINYCMGFFRQAWRAAFEKVKESKDHVYKQQGGQKDDQIIGFPKNIKPEAIQMTLLKIANGDEQVC